MKIKRNNISIDEKYNSIFATRLRIALDASKLSQKELAKTLGLSAQMVSNYCLGNNPPPLTVLTAIAKTLNVSSDYLLGLTENESVRPDIRAIGDYTGLTTNSIEVLHKYNRSPLFADVVNFLFTDLKFLESVSDFLTAPFLDILKDPMFDHVNLMQNYLDRLLTLRAFDLHDNAISAQKDFANMHEKNQSLQDYVIDRYIAKVSPDSRACNTQGHYDAFSMLHSLVESSISPSDSDNFAESLDFFGVGDISHAKAVKKVGIDNIIKSSTNSDFPSPQKQ